MPHLRFKVARDARELEQVNALQYRAFVEEIPQHPRNDDRRHVDRFHDDNVYIVAMDGETVIGSIAIREERPFSLDAKVQALDSYVPSEHRFCEIRLLNVAKEHRAGGVLPGLIAGAWDYATSHGFSGALISATTRQLKLYAHMGFVPFGPLVGTADAPFQPMYLTVDAFRARAREISSLPPGARGEMANLLSGPVAIHPDVMQAFARAPQSHRSAAFVEELRALKTSLRTVTKAADVQLLLGSGTLANDVVAAQLSLLGGHGVVASNGEFGERLADHASRARLSFEHVRAEWGEPLDFDAVAKRDFDWLWITACETSTGVLNDIAAASELCRARGAKLVLDCVSAIGAVPLDLSNVWLATGTSGKALASFAGLALVFHQHPVAVSGSIPRYLDLGIYARDGVPFTQSSNLVHALRVAVDRVDWTARFEQVTSIGAWLRGRLRETGLTVVGDHALPAPHVITLALPAEIHSDDAARALERSGFLIGHASGYLRERNWIQICLMGEVTREVLPSLLRALTLAAPPARRMPPSPRPSSLPLPR